MQNDNIFNFHYRLLPHNVSCYPPQSERERPSPPLMFSWKNGVLITPSWQLALSADISLGWFNTQVFAAMLFPIGWKSVFAHLNVKARCVRGCNTLDRDGHQMCYVFVRWLIKKCITVYCLCIFSLLALLVPGTNWTNFWVFLKPFFQFVHWKLCLSVCYLVHSQNT